MEIIGADSTGATGTSPWYSRMNRGKLLRFAPVPFMAVLWFFEVWVQVIITVQ